MVPVSLPRTELSAESDAERATFEASQGPVNSRSDVRKSEAGRYSLAALFPYGQSADFELVDRQPVDPSRQEREPSDRE